MWFDKCRRRHSKHEVADNSTFNICIKWEDNRIYWAKQDTPNNSLQKFEKKRFLPLLNYRIVQGTDQFDHWKYCWLIMFQNNCSDKDETGVIRTMTSFEFLDLHCTAVQLICSRRHVLSLSHLCFIIATTYFPGPQPPNLQSHIRKRLVHSSPDFDTQLLPQTTYLQRKAWCYMFSKTMVF